MKKFLAVLVVMMLCGCSSGTDDEKLVRDNRCDACGSDFAYSEIVEVDGASICTTCFSSGEGYMICRNCGEIYRWDSWDSFDGYCIACSVTETWSCAYCEDRQDVRDMIEVEPGYFLCASCIYEKAVDQKSDFVKELHGLDEILMSRNDYLAREMEDSVLND